MSRNAITCREAWEMLERFYQIFYNDKYNGAKFHKGTHKESQRAFA